MPKGAYVATFGYREVALLRQASQQMRRTNLSNPRRTEHDRIPGLSCQARLHAEDRLETGGSLVRTFR